MEQSGSGLDTANVRMASNEIKINLEMFINKFWQSFSSRLEKAGSKISQSTCSATKENLPTLEIADFANTFFSSNPLVEDVFKVYEDSFPISRTSVLDNVMLNRIRLQGCLSDILWSLPLTLCFSFAPEIETQYSHRPSSLIVQRLFILEDFALNHIQNSLGMSSSNVFLSEHDIYQFVKNPTRLFVILELVYIFEACNYFRETVRTVSPFLVFSQTACRPFTKHPLLLELPCHVPSLSTASLLIFESIASSFLSMLYYCLQEIIEPVLVVSEVNQEMLERCLIMYLLMRVPPGPAFKTYIPEMVPILLRIFSNEDEHTATIAHRLLFSIFKNFHRDFDAAENYLQLASCVYSQTLHFCTNQLKHWTAVINVQPISAVDSLTTKETNEDFNFNDSKSDQFLQFLFINQGTVIIPGRSSLNVVIEIPLMIMLLMQLQVPALCSHAPIILERVLQFLSFTEPHKNYLRLENSLKRGIVPYESITILDFKVQRDLLDAQIKTIAFMSFFLKGPSTLSQTQGQHVVNGSLFNSSISDFCSEIGSVILDYLDFVPYQVGYPALFNCICLVTEDSRHVKIVPKPTKLFFNQIYDRVKSIYCRREILVSFRSILRSFQFLVIPSCGLFRYLQCWTYLGTGVQAADYLRPFMYQLRIELLNSLRSSSFIQKLLLSDAASIRQSRLECLHAFTHTQFDIINAVVRLSFENRSNRLKSAFRWNLVDSQMFQKEPKTTSSSLHEEPQTLSYGEIRALLLSRSHEKDLQLAALLPPDKFLPISLLSQLAQEICCDLHDSTISLYTQTHIANCLVTLVEWVDRFSLVDVRNSQSIGKQGDAAMFMDQKEATEIQRRILESCSSKLRSLYNMFEQQANFFYQPSTMQHFSTDSGRSTCGLHHSEVTYLTDNPNADLFLNSRQAAWVNPPLFSYENFQASSNNTNAIDVLREIRLMTRSLCQVVRMASFLLTFVGIPTGDSTLPSSTRNNTVSHNIPSSAELKDSSYMMRLQHSVPLSDADYQMVRNSFFYIIYISVLYGKAMSNVLCKPQLKRKMENGLVHNIWLNVCKSKIMNTASGGCMPTTSVQENISFPQLEHHMLTIQQDQRELLDAAISILTTFHPAIAHRFFICELSLLVHLVEEEPGLLVIFELLSQYSQITLTFRRLLKKYLIPLLPCLADTLCSSSVTIPYSLGSPIHMYDSRKNIKKDQDILIKRGSFIYTSKNDIKASEILAALESETDLPTDIFNVTFQNLCPTRLIVDEELDFMPFNDISLEWDSKKNGFHYKNCSFKNIQQPSKVQLSSHFSLPYNSWNNHLLPEILNGIPSCLSQPSCLHYMPFRSAHEMHACSYASSRLRMSMNFSHTYPPSFHIGRRDSLCKEKCTTVTDEFNVNESQEKYIDPPFVHERISYKYILSGKSARESSAMSVYLTPRLNWLKKTKTVLVSSSATSWKTLPELVSENIPEYCIALDATLVTSAFMEPSLQKREAHTDSLITPLTMVVGIEGFLPGAETLTHTSTGHQRLTFVQILLYLWKLYITVGSRSDDQYIMRVVESIIPTCLVLCSRTCRPEALLCILRFFLRFIISTRTAHNQAACRHTGGKVISNPGDVQKPQFCSSWFLSSSNIISSMRTSDKLFQDTLAHICLMNPVNAAFVATHTSHLVAPLVHSLSSRDPECIGTALRALDTMTDTLHSDVLWDYFNSPLQKNYRINYRSPFFSSLVSLIDSRTQLPKYTLHSSNEKKLVEYRDPYTGRVLYHEGTVKTDGCPLQSTFSFFACRVIGKLSRLCRTLIFEPSLLDGQPQINEIFGFFVSLSNGENQKKIPTIELLQCNRSINLACALLKRPSLPVPTSFDEYQQTFAVDCCRTSFDESSYKTACMLLNDHLQPASYPIRLGSYFDINDPSDDSTIFMPQSSYQKLKRTNEFHMNADYDRSTVDKISTDRLLNHDNSRDSKKHAKVYLEATSKQIALQFLKCVLICMLGLQEGEIPFAQDTKLSCRPYNTCLSKFYDTLHLILKGLLHGATCDSDQFLKNEAVHILDFSAKVIEGIILLYMKNLNTISGTPSYCDFLLFIKALADSLDLRKWGACVQIAKIMKKIFKGPFDYMRDNMSKTSTQLNAIGFCLINPILRKCQEGATFTIRGAASYVLFTLLDELPLLLIEQNFQSIGLALIQTIHGPLQIPKSSTNLLLDSNRVLSASISVDSVLKLVFFFFQSEFISWNTILENPTEDYSRQFYGWFFSTIPKMLVDADAFVQEFGFRLMHDIPVKIGISLDKFLLQALPSNIIDQYGIRRNCAVEPFSDQDQSFFVLLNSEKTIYEKTIHNTLLEQIIIAVEIVLSRFALDSTLSVVAILTFLISNQNIPYTDTFLLRCTCIALAGYSFLKKKKSYCITDTDANATSLSTDDRVPEIQNELENSALAIKILRLVKIIELHPTKQQIGVFLCRTKSTDKLQKIIVTDQQERIAIPPLIFKKLHVTDSSLLTKKFSAPNVLECLGLEFFLEALIDINVHIARAAIHALLVLGSYEVLHFRRNLNCVTFSSLYTEEFLFSHLKTAFSILGDPTKRTSVHFLALSRVIHMFKETFQSTSVSSRLVDVAFGLCDVCDGLVKQLTGATQVGFLGTQLMSALTLFSSSLTMETIPAVAVGVLACFAGVHQSAFTSPALSRSCLRLVVGLLDFVDLTLFQAQYQTKLLSTMPYDEVTYREKSQCERDSSSSHIIDDADQEDTNTDTVILQHVCLHNVFIDFCVAHPDTIVDAVWIRNDSPTPTNSLDAHSSTKFGLPFMLARGKTSAFVFRGLNDPRATSLRSAMAKKSALMSRILKQRSDIHCPGFMFYALYTSNNVSSEKTNAKQFPVCSKTNYVQTNPSQNHTNQTSDFSSRQKQFNNDVTDFASNNKEYVSWLSNDIAGNTTENISTPSADIVTIILTLNSFDSQFLWRNWVLHLWLSLKQSPFGQTLLLPNETTIYQVQPFCIFHLYPYVLDLNCVWTSNYSYPLIHCILDIWSMAAGFLLQTVSGFKKITKSNSMDIKDEATPIHNKSSFLSSSKESFLTYQHNLYNQLHETDKCPLTGSSWSSYFSLGQGGCVMSNSFHSLFHTPLAVSITYALCDVLLFSFRGESSTIRDTFICQNSEITTLDHNIWARVQTIIFQLKTFLMLCIPLGLRAAQNYSFLDSFFPQNYISYELSSYLIRFFFRFSLFNNRIPCAFKILIARYIIIPLFIYLIKENVEVEPDLKMELISYFYEIMCLSPNPVLRETPKSAIKFDRNFEFVKLEAFVKTNKTNSQYAASLLKCNLVVNSVSHLTAQYFELILNRYGFFPHSNIDESEYCSTQDLLENEELQIEILRVLRFLSELTFKNISIKNVPVVSNVSLFVSHLMASEYLVVRHWSYLYLSCALRSCPWMFGHQIPSYFTSTSVLLEFLVALLECPQLETRVITRRCLDSLITSGHFSPKFLTWKFILPSFYYFRSCETRMPHVQILQNLCQLIVRHRELFYECRNYIIVPCTVVLGRIALNSSGDVRRVILDLIHVILDWELQSHIDHSSSWWTLISDFRIIETCAYYAMKAVLTSANEPPLAARGISCITRCFLLCPSIVVRLHSLLKCLVLHLSIPVPPTHSNGFLVKRSNVYRIFFLVLQILHAMMTFQCRKAILKQLALILQVLDPIWISTDSEVIDWIMVVIRRIVSVMELPNKHKVIDILNTLKNCDLSPSQLCWIRLTEIIICGLQNTSHLLSRGSNRQNAHGLERFLVNNNNSDNPKEKQVTSTYPSFAQYKTMNLLLASLKHASLHPLNSTSTCKNSTSNQDRLHIDPYISCRLLFVLYTSLPCNIEITRRFILINFGYYIIHAIQALFNFLKDQQATVKPNDYSKRSDNRPQHFESLNISGIFGLENRSQLLLDFLRLAGCLLFLEHPNQLKLVTDDVSFSSSLSSEYVAFHSTKTLLQKAYYAFLLDIPENLTNWNLKNDILRFVIFLFYGVKKNSKAFRNPNKTTMSININNNTVKQPQNSDFLDTSLNNTLYETCDFSNECTETNILQTFFDNPFDEQETSKINNSWKFLRQHRLQSLSISDTSTHKIIQAWKSSTDFQLLHLSFLLYSWADVYISPKVESSSQNLYLTSVLRVLETKPTTSSSCSDTSISDDQCEDVPWRFFKKEPQKNFFNLAHSERYKQIGFWVSHLQHRLRYLKRVKNSKNCKNSFFNSISFHCHFLNLTYPLLLGTLSPDLRIHQKFVKVLQKHFSQDPFRKLMAFISLPELQLLQKNNFSGILSILLLQSRHLHISRIPSWQFGFTQNCYSKQQGHVQSNITILSEKIKTTLSTGFKAVEYLCHAYTSASEDVLAALIPLIWGSVKKEQQIMLGEAIINLLSYSMPSLIEKNNAINSIVNDIKSTDNSAVYRFSFFTDQLLDFDSNGIVKLKLNLDAYDDSCDYLFLLKQNIPKYKKVVCDHNDSTSTKPQHSSHASNTASPQDNNSQFSAFHQRAASQMISENTVSSLGIFFLKILQKCSPLIIFPCELLQYIAYTSGFYHLSIQTLIHQFFSLPPHMSPTKHCHFIADLCQKIHDNDTVYAISYLLSLTKETQCTLSSVALGEWWHAQQKFNVLFKELNINTSSDTLSAQHCLAALHISQKGLIPVHPTSPSETLGFLKQNETQKYNEFLHMLDLSFIECEDGKTLNEAKPQFSHESTRQIDLLKCPLDLGLVSEGMKHELKTWTRDWISASTQLNQWNCLSEISSVTSVPLAQEAKSKLQDWSGIERLMTTYNIASSQASVALFYATLQKTANVLPYHLSTRSSNTTGEPSVTGKNFSEADSPVSSGKTTASAQSVNFSDSSRTYPTAREAVSGQTFSPNSTSSLGNTSSTAPQSIPFLHRQIKTMQQLLTVCQRLIVVETCQFPSIPGPMHLKSFLTAQLHVEAMEGLRWVVEFLRKIIAPHILHGDFPITTQEAVDNRALMSTWRSRLLSDVDDMRSWSDLLVWRNCLFTVVQSLVCFCPVLPQDQQALWATYQQDVAWTILKFAQVAHWPHGLPDVTLALLSKLHTLHTFFTSPAYSADYLVTINRCVKLCTTQEERLAALNLLRAIDFNAHGQHISTDYPEPLDKLKANIHVCKSRILASLPQIYASDNNNNNKELDDESFVIRRSVLRSPSKENSVEPPHTAMTESSISDTRSTYDTPQNVSHVFNELNHALELCPTLSRAWATWGFFSDKIFSSRRMHNQKTSKPLHKHNDDTFYGASAITGYLVASYLSPEKVLRYIPRIFVLLSYDDKHQTLARTFTRFSDIILPTSWLPWIPQLLSNLERPEALTSYTILWKILLECPQNVYLDIRSFCMEQSVVLNQFMSNNVFSDINSVPQNVSTLSSHSATLKPADHINHINKQERVPLLHPYSQEEEISYETMSTSNVQENHNMNQFFGSAIAKKLSEFLLHHIYTSTAAATCAALDGIVEIMNDVALSFELDDIVNSMEELLDSLLSLPICCIHIPESLCEYMYMRCVLPCVNYLFRNVKITTSSQAQSSKTLSICENYDEPKSPEKNSKTFLNMKTPLEECDHLFSLFHQDFLSFFSLRDGQPINNAKKKTWSEALQNLKEPWRSFREMQPYHTVQVIKRWIEYIKEYAHSSLLENYRVPVESDKQYRCCELLRQMVYLHTPLLIPNIHSQAPFCNNSFQSCTERLPYRLTGFELSSLTFERHPTKITTVFQMGASNGSIFSFIPQRCKTPFQQRSEKRMAYLMHHFNKFFLAGKEARRKCLKIPINTTISIHPYVSLVNCTSFISLSEIFSTTQTKKNKSDLCFEALYMKNVQTVAKDAYQKSLNNSTAANSESLFTSQDLDSTNERFNENSTYSPESIIKACMIVNDQIRLSVSSYDLYNYLISRYPDAQRFEHAQQRITADLAMLFILGYSFLTADPFTPQALCLDKQGTHLMVTHHISTILSPSFDMVDLCLSQQPQKCILPFSLISSPFTKKLNYPFFRLTPNILYMIGVVKRLGMLPNSIFSALRTFFLPSNNPALQSILFNTLKNDIHSRLIAEQLVKCSKTQPAWNELQSINTHSQTFTLSPTVKFLKEVAIFSWLSQRNPFNHTAHHIDRIIKSNNTASAQKKNVSFNNKNDAEPFTAASLNPLSNYELKLKSKAEENLSLILQHIKKSTLLNKNKNSAECFGPLETEEVPLASENLSDAKPSSKSSPQTSQQPLNLAIHDTKNTSSLTIIASLLDSSSDSRNISLMKPSWAPWI